MGNMDKTFDYKKSTKLRCLLLIVSLPLFICFVVLVFVIWFPGIVIVYCPLDGFAKHAVISNMTNLRMGGNNHLTEDIKRRVEIWGDNDPFFMGVIKAPITDDCMVHVAQLEKLETLVLSGEYFEELGVQNGSKIGDSGMLYLPGLIKLRHLDLAKAKVTNEGLLNISGLTELKVLNLSETLIGNSGLRHISNLSNIHRLNLRRTDIGDEGVRFISNLTNIEYLDLSFTNLGDEGVGFLMEMTRLKYLNLSNTNVGDEALGYLSGMKNLEEINLKNTRVGDRGVRQSLVNMSSVRLINLQKTLVTEEGLNLLQKEMADCKIVPWNF